MKTPYILTLLLITPLAFAGKIHEAAQSGDIQTVKRLLESGISPDERDEFGRTPLMLAAANGHIDVIDELIWDDANIDLQSFDESYAYTALMYAVAGNNTEAIQRLLDVEPQIELKNILGQTAFYLLISDETEIDLELVKSFIDADANVNTCDFQGCTPLILSAERSNIDLMRLLIENGANVNQPEFSHKTPLIIATVNGSLASMQVLLESGAKINSRWDFGNTALLDAFDAIPDLGLLEKVVKLLIDYGADPLVIGAWEKTPSQLAQEKGYEDLTNFLQCAEIDYIIDQDEANA
ncbi:MAG: hypothetical protein A2Y14_05720 [Verrucomicrobia bacterium GWF2_51_19]|nr:MAG: hypothetical protein A2Y14_05720 [Verrucomicrobia bacterium GWF2_51_19]HCJ12150.1 hypothetical protein [Opitutae bacterium]